MPCLALKLHHEQNSAEQARQQLKTSSSSDAGTNHLPARAKALTSVIHSISLDLDQATCGNRLVLLAARGPGNVTANTFPAQEAVEAPVNGPDFFSLRL